MTKNKKLLITIACLTVILCSLITGTIAWLSDKTNSVTNTFLPSNIKISLTETKGGADKEFKMVPGTTIEKDPKVTVEADSEACYVFIKIEENLGSWKVGTKTFSDYLSYEVITGPNGWKQLTGVDGIVYYRTVDATTAKNGDSFDILTGNAVTVLGTVTKADMELLYAPDATLPTLTFTAYACQQANGTDAGFTPEAAWAEAQNAPVSGN